MTNEELQAQVYALTTQNARLREALENYHTVFPEAGMVDDAGDLVWDEDADNLLEHEDLVRVGDIAAAALAETPAQSLEAVRAEARREARKEIAEITAKLFPELRGAIRSAVWSETETIQGAMAKALKNVRAEAGRERNLNGGRP